MRTSGTLEFFPLGTGSRETAHLRVPLRVRPFRYSINVTLDDCCDHPAIPADEGLHRHAVENIEQADALLFGRVTYEMMVRLWLKRISWCLVSLTVVIVALAITAWFNPPLVTWLYTGVLRMNRPVPPVRVADNMFYVGSSDLAAFLVAGDHGHVLIDSGSIQTEPQILANIRTLGFNAKDVKIILNTHGHFDHAAGIAALKAATGARLYASPEEAKLIESGGRGDFVFGDHIAYAPAKVDHVLTDGEVVQVGNLSLTAHFTPGHTKGCTSWTMALTIDGEAHNMLLICSGLSTAGALKDNVAYPRIAEDFRESFARLESFPCEIFLAPHASMFGLQSKRVLGTPEAFLDTVGCAAFIRRQKQAFEAALAGED